LGLDEDWLKSQNSLVSSSHHHHHHAHSSHQQSKVSMLKSAEMLSPESEMHSKSEDRHVHRDGSSPPLSLKSKNQTRSVKGMSHQSLSGDWRADAIWKNLFAIYFFLPVHPHSQLGKAWNGTY
jgi:hypothetical protein